MDEQPAVHPIYRPLVTSGLAFGARRWLATLQCHCESLVSLLASNISPRDLGGIYKILANVTQANSALAQNKKRMARIYTKKASLVLLFLLIYVMILTWLDFVVSLLFLSFSLLSGMIFIFFVQSSKLLKAVVECSV